MPWPSTSIKPWTLTASTTKHPWSSRIPDPSRPVTGSHANAHTQSRPESRPVTATHAQSHTSCTVTPTVTPSHSVRPNQTHSCPPRPVISWVLEHHHIAPRGNGAGRYRPPARAAGAAGLPFASAGGGSTGRPRDFPGSSFFQDVRGSPSEAG